MERVVQEKARAKAAKNRKHAHRALTTYVEITCLPLPEQACIQLVTGPLHCRNCGKAFSSPKCELSYRLLPWNPEMENFVGAPTGIEPASPAFRAGVLTTTPQHPGTKCFKFAISNHPWQMVYNS